MRCGRCGEEMNAHIMSYFDDKDICLRCDDVERAHPAFKEASERELKEVQRGNFNFLGVGVPNDIYALCREARRQSQSSETQ